jgi:hypothetical protein
MKNNKTQNLKLTVTHSKKTDALEFSKKSIIYQKYEKVIKQRQNAE